MTKNVTARAWGTCDVSCLSHSFCLLQLSHSFHFISPGILMAPSSDIDIDPTSEEVLLTFYRRLYPFKQLFKWLNRGPERAEKESRLFPYREFAFTLRNDAYLRYNSYSSDVEMKKHVCLLTPSRFEIGPVYSAQVRRC